MAKIPDDFIQDLLNRVDIVDVVERYLPLKKAGQNYSACCPFHKEKSPSFTVSQTKQFYHCFGCGAHGSALGFVMEHQALSFPDAVRMLAESVGMQVPVSDAPVSEKAKAAPGIYDVMKTAMNYYRAQLKTAPAAIEYLKSRGVEGRTALAWSSAEEEAAAATARAEKLAQMQQRLAAWQAQQEEQQQ